MTAHSAFTEGEQLKPMATGGKVRTFQLCRTCRSWSGSRLAHPELSECAGSMWICDKGHETHAGSWKPCWEARTTEQLAEEA